MTKPRKVAAAAGASRFCALHATYPEALEELVQRAVTCANIFHTIQHDDPCECAVFEYAFITEEVPQGWFGTEFNDFFETSINSGQSATVLSSYVSNADSVNGLNPGAFNAENPAATCCYVLNLNVKDRNLGLPITFAGAVANAVDPFLQSALCGRVYCADKTGKHVGNKLIKPS